MRIDCHLICIPRQARARSEKTYYNWSIAAIKQTNGFSRPAVLFVCRVQRAMTLPLHVYDNNNNNKNRQFLSSIAFIVCRKKPSSIVKTNATRQRNLEATRTPWKAAGIESERMMTVYRCTFRRGLQKEECTESIIDKASVINDTANSRDARGNLSLLSLVYTDVSSHSRGSPSPSLSSVWTIKFSRCTYARRTMPASVHHGPSTYANASASVCDADLPASEARARVIFTRSRRIYAILYHTRVGGMYTRTDIGVPGWTYGYCGLWHVRVIRSLDSPEGSRRCCWRAIIAGGLRYVGQGEKLNDLFFSELWMGSRAGDVLFDFRSRR